MNYDRVVKRSLEKKDYEGAAQYATNVLAECPASVTHHCLKVEYLLRAYKLKEALQFS
jgi:hypothetical protein